ncbi:hypothetical protein CF326_g6216 [Tilletia indica]|nr:hypothetical protein CF326_g6216 [Tilletia indica]
MDTTNDGQSGSSTSNLDPPMEGGANPSKRGRGRPKGSGKKGSAAPEPSPPPVDSGSDGADNGNDTDSDDDISHIVPAWDPMHWRDVVLITRELFSHLVPCCDNWTDEQRVKIGNMLIDLGFALFPSNY